ncbi:glucose-6-phosphate dehydrogenase [Mrakia frigida]|uniref:glucose-6-phosphate dehydrogenase n=1 Tax=Mrakia frigida TaxID=29902 RepID=UPI003FCC25C2
MSAQVQDNPNEVLTDETIIVVFGASGDLAKKSTFPALYALLLQDLLPKSVRILGYSRSDLSGEKWRKQLLGGVEADEESGELEKNDEKKKHFESISSYSKGPYDEDSGFKGLEEQFARIEKDEFDGKKANRYLALPPSKFVEVSHMLKKHNYSKDKANRIVIEKPFGKDSESCDEMMSKILGDWDEKEIYRIDHFLGDDTCRLLLQLRFANTWVDSLLNAQHVSKISVIMSETFGAEGRGGYFDEFGMIRDVCQNHLLQALTLLTMEAPSSLHGEGIRDAKVEVLKAMPPIKKEDVVLGQYVSSKTDPKKNSYVLDDTVPDDSKTETFAEFEMRINNDRWKGVPIIMKTGKGMDTDLITFKFHFVPPPSLFSDVEPTSNVLEIQVSPSPSITLSTNILEPGSLVGAKTVNVPLKYVVPKQKLAMDKKAYEVIIYNVIQGDKSGFVREDELVESWRIFTPILHWKEGADGPSPEPYEYGSKGPEEAMKKFEARYEQ